MKIFPNSPLGKKYGLKLLTSFLKAAVSFSLSSFMILFKKFAKNCWLRTANRQLLQMSFFSGVFLGIPNCCLPFTFYFWMPWDLQTETNPTRKNTLGYTCLMMIIRLLKIHIAGTAVWVGKWLRQIASDQK